MEAELETEKISIKSEDDSQYDAIYSTSPAFSGSEVKAVDIKTEELILDEQDVALSRSDFDPLTPEVVWIKSEPVTYDEDQTMESNHELYSSGGDVNSSLPSVIGNNIKNINKRPANADSRQECHNRMDYSDKLYTHALVLCSVEKEYLLLNIKKELDVPSLSIKTSEHCNHQCIIIQRNFLSELANLKATLEWADNLRNPVYTHVLVMCKVEKEYIILEKSEINLSSLKITNPDHCDHECIIIQENSTSELEKIKAVLKEIQTLERTALCNNVAGMLSSSDYPIEEEEHKPSLDMAGMLSSSAYPIEEEEHKPSLGLPELISPSTSTAEVPEQKPLLEPKYTLKMPRAYQRKSPYRCVVTDEQLKAAKLLISSGASKRKAAAQVGLKESTLRKRLKAGKTATSMGRFSLTFTKEQENDIYEYIKRSDDLYNALTMQNLQKLVYEYAEVNNITHRFNTSSKLAGRDWVYGFLKRFPELKLR